MSLTWGNGGALGGTRTPNLLIRSQMLYPLSYERRLTSDSVRHLQADVRISVRLDASVANPVHDESAAGPPACESIRIVFKPVQQLGPTVPPAQRGNADHLGCSHCGRR